MYSKAWEGRPPLHPLLSKSPAQSSSYYSLKIEGDYYVYKAQWLSIAPVVEKVQQLPQLIWSLTWVTIFFNLINNK